MCVCMVTGMEWCYESWTCWRRLWMCLLRPFTHFLFTGEPGWSSVTSSPILKWYQVLFFIISTLCSAAVIFTFMSQWSRCFETKLNILERTCHNLSSPLCFLLSSSRCRYQTAGLKISSWPTCTQSCRWSKRRCRNIRISSRPAFLRALTSSPRLQWPTTTLEVQLLPPQYTLCTLEEYHVGGWVWSHSLLFNFRYWPSFGSVQWVEGPGSISHWQHGHVLQPPLC